MLFICCSKLKLPLFSLLLLHTRNLSALAGGRQVWKSYISHLIIVIHQYPKEAFALKKLILLDRFPAVELQNVTYSFGGINNDAHRDLNIDKKLNSGVSTAPTHNTDTISICFMPRKGTIENKRKGSSIRVCQKCQLSILYICISLQSPLTKQQLNKWSLHICLEENPVVTGGGSGT